MLNWRKQTKQLFVVVCILASALVLQGKASADTVPTVVIVGNNSPVITVNVAENPGSDGVTPTNVGNAITFELTATDGGAENYYLAVCVTNNVTANAGAAPTCNGGAICVSAATSSGSVASCQYTPNSGDAESISWFAFACDGNATTPSCSTADQGSGVTGSPFKVNHAPNFSAASVTPAADPGDTITFSATASDTDIDTQADTVMLLVCRTAGVTGTSCDGGGADTWCNTAYVNNAPSCQANLNLVLQAGTQNAYFYIFDQHGMPSSSGLQGAVQNFAVNNTAPMISNVTINGGADISLTEGATTPVVVAGTIADSNSCTDINTVTASVYRSGVGAAACNQAGEANNNSCYPVITCAVLGGSCSGATDATADYICTVNLQYHADPTDANTQFPGENWLASMAADDGANNISTQSPLGVEMNSMVAYTVTSSINYGTVNIGQSNDPLNRIVTVTSTGNVGIDVEFSGTSMLSGANILAVSNQKYATASGTSYAAGTSLSSSPVEAELNVPKTIATATPLTRNSWWGILIPNGTAPGTYTGTNTVTAVKGEVANW